MAERGKEANTHNLFFPGPRYPFFFFLNVFLIPVPADLTINLQDLHHARNVLCISSLHKFFKFKLFEEHTCGKLMKTVSFVSSIGTYNIVTGIGIMDRLRACYT